MPAAPRVTAKAAYEEPFELRTRGYVPEVTLEASFDFGDHEAALRALDEVVDSVRQQITQTIPDD